MKRLFVLLIAIMMQIGLMMQPELPAVVADVAFTQMVNDAYFARTIDSGVVALAEQRASQIVNNFSHDGVPSGYAEVIAWNSGHEDPAARAIVQWKNSPPHHAILSDPAYGVIGCGTAVSDGVYFFACLLPWGSAPAPAPVPATPVPQPAATPVPAVPASAAPQPQPLPDTALDVGS